jgi:hypothetical protein
MGTPVVQCKGNLGGHSSVSGAVPWDIIRRCTDGVPPRASTPQSRSRSCLESVYARAGGNCGVEQSTGTMLVLC